MAWVDEGTAMSDNKQAFIIFLVAPFIILASAIAYSWYLAGIQVAVYERQGVHMTRMEVFLGAEPIVRPVIIQEQP